MNLHTKLNDCLCRETALSVTAMDSPPRILSAEEWQSAVALAPDHAPHVHRVDKYTVAKSGLDEKRAKAETAAMELVRNRTTIPVPKVHNCYFVEDRQSWCILMDYVEGEVLRDTWDEASIETKANILQQLKGYFNELHSVKGEFIGSVDGSHCEDQFFEDSDPQGPFATVAEFHGALVNALRAAEENPFVDMVAGFIAALPAHEIVLTHSDFAPRNIIVHGDKVVGVLDWELAGFYPAYWEYVKALYRPNWSSAWIKDQVVDQVLPPHPLEHAVLLHTRDIVG